MTRRTWVPIALGLAFPVAFIGTEGCKKDEPPPPLPSATAAPLPSAPPVLELAVEDSGPVDAGAPKVVGKGGGGGAKNVLKCCAALKQNAASAPPPTNAYLENAAASCFAMAKQNQSAIPPGWAALTPACR